MFDFVFHALVYSLAIYGLLEIIKTIIYIMEYTNLSEDRNICYYCCEKSGKENRGGIAFNII